MKLSFIMLISFAILPLGLILGQNDALKHQVVPDSVFLGKTVHIYFMAGQSNMAGRGTVSPEDTLINKRVISLPKDGYWVYAQEPLHHYEPSRTGLDCGKSFGEYMAQVTPDDVIIALVPIAIGGSAIDQWINNDTYRGVKLYSNFLEKLEVAKGKGQVKGIIWHQGESDSRPGRVEGYQEKIKVLFTKMKQDIGAPDIPIILGEVGHFWVEYKNPVYAAEINRQIRNFTEENENIGLIRTNNLNHKGDTLHFDSESLRVMGERYAEEILKLQFGQEEGAIRIKTKEFSSLLVSGNFQGVANCYTKNGLLFPPGNAIIKGKENILTYWTPGEHQTSQIVYHKVIPEHIEIIGDKAIDFGIYYGRSLSDNGEESSWGGKYVIIWKKENGEWKMDKDIWNRGN